MVTEKQSEIEFVAHALAQAIVERQMMSTPRMQALDVLGRLAAKAALVGSMAGDLHAEAEAVIKAIDEYRNA